MLGISRVFEDEDNDDDSGSGASEEERAFRCKLIADEFRKRRRVMLTMKTQLRYQHERYFQQKNLCALRTLFNCVCKAKTNVLTAVNQSKGITHKVTEGAKNKYKPNV